MMDNAISRMKATLYKESIIAHPVLKGLSGINIWILFLGINPQAKNDRSPAATEKQPAINKSILIQSQRTSTRDRRSPIAAAGFILRNTKLALKHRAKSNRFSRRAILGTHKGCPYHCFLIMLIAGLLLAGCQPASIRRLPDLPTKTPYPFVTATTGATFGAPQAETPTPSPTVVRTIPPSPTPVPSESVLPTALPSATPTPTETNVAQKFCPPLPAGPIRTVYETITELPVIIGCAVAPDESPDQLVWEVEARFQPMERGHILWLNSVGWYEGRIVIVLLEDHSTARYEDTYIAGVDARSGGPTPPEGLYQPVESLGKVWRLIPGLSDDLGFGIEPQKKIDAQMTLFEQGEIIYLPGIEVVFVITRRQPVRWDGYSL
jgi:hypothetical protein